MGVDILFPCWNRRDFTVAALSCLIANTDWGMVDRLIIVDDGSEDGTREVLDGFHAAWPSSLLHTEFILRAERYGSPVAIMQSHVNDENAAEVFAKVDNDVLVPPGWLEAMLGVLDRHPYVELLGMEAGMAGVPGRDGEPLAPHDFEPATNIGGVGLMRTSAFRCRPRMQYDGLFGFTEWQHTYRPTRGWIRPDLPVVLLDRLPFEPWASLSAGYVEQGWQRDWPKWDPRWMDWAWTWMPDDLVSSVDAA